MPLATLSQHRLIPRTGYKRAEYATDSLKVLQRGRFVLRLKRILGSSAFPRPKRARSAREDEGAPRGIMCQMAGRSPAGRLGVLDRGKVT
jgi:hypothetical protein